MESRRFCAIDRMSLECVSASPRLASRRDRRSTPCSSSRHVAERWDECRSTKISRRVVLRTLFSSIVALTVLVAGVAAAAEVSVIDDSGKTVRLRSAARRVVSLAPHTTELLDQAGAFDEIVAVSAYSDFPARARQLPVIGSAHGLDVEAIARLHPDLVLAWTSGNSASQVAAIEHLGIPVFRSDPLELEAIATSLERLGVLTGHDALAAGRARAFREDIEQLRRRYADRASVRVFYQVWDQPLMTVGGGHLISKVIRLCGGRNIFESLTTPAPVVDREAVIAADPQIIVLASDADDPLQNFTSWQQWTQVSAVREHQLLTLSPGEITRESPRIALGARTLCEALERVRH
jgi:iron complex transport system substrate-binding protein